MAENTALVQMLASQRGSLDQWVQQLNRAHGQAHTLEARLEESTLAGAALQVRPANTDKSSSDAGIDEHV